MARIGRISEELSEREPTTGAFTHYVPREHFQPAPRWAIERGIEAVRKVGVGG